jgi:hypothetical protein
MTDYTKQKALAGIELSIKMMNKYKS